MFRIGQLCILCCLMLGIKLDVTMARINQASQTNLTSILWAHAVNSQALLEHALADNIDMIEADIVLGKLENDESDELYPVMGHPPANISDIKLETFLRRIYDYNTQHPSRQKGVKLDFKSTVVFEGSLDILSTMWEEMNYPVWLNADILPGPVNPTNVPVDANFFLGASKMFPSAILSIGWTTQWGSNFTHGSYTQQQIDDMVNTVKVNEIAQMKREITFPVRAGIAAESLSELLNLFNALRETNKVTLTIWSSNGDYVNIEKLRYLIFTFGLDKVYLDVPKEVSSKLDLSRNGTISHWPSLVTFSLVNLVMIVVSLMFRTKS